MQYINQIIKASRLLNFVSPEILQPLIDQFNADFSAKKLHAIIFFKLFLFSWAFDKKSLSLRTIAENSKSLTFKELAQLDGNFSAEKSSLGERLEHIPYQLFQILFEQIAQKAFTLSKNQLSSNKKLTELINQSRILDSTVITLSSKLLKVGYQINKGQLSLKASIAIQGKQIPIKALVLTDKKYSSEDKALPKLFDFSKKNIIYIFDRGIQRLQTYVDIVDSENHFVSRLKAKNYNVVKINSLPKNKETDKLTIIKDEFIVLDKIEKENNNKKQTFRLVTAISKKDNKQFQFITDLTDLSVIEITELYRYRWSIEVFFKFLKQELNLENLLSYNENGIKVHVYLTLIAFLLTWIFKEQNNIRSFKRAREKLRFALLDMLMKHQFQQGFLAGTKSKELLNPL